MRTAGRRHQGTQEIAQLAGGDNSHDCRLFPRLYLRGSNLQGLAHQRLNMKDAVLAGIADLVLDRERAAMVAEAVQAHLHGVDERLVLGEGLGGVLVDEFALGRQRCCEPP